MTTEQTARAAEPANATTTEPARRKRAPKIRLPFGGLQCAALQCAAHRSAQTIRSVYRGLGDDYSHTAILEAATKLGLPLPPARDLNH